MVFSYQVEHIAPTVLESINKIGSMVNGPLLGVFLLAIFAAGVGQRAVISGFVAGLAANLYCWLALPGVSWLWWNVLGLCVCLSLAWLLGKSRVVTVDADILEQVNRRYVVVLLNAFVVILGVCAGMQWLI